MTRRKVVRSRPDDELLDQLADLVGFGRGRQVVSLGYIGKGSEIGLSVGAHGKLTVIGRGGDVRAAIAASMVGKRRKAKTAKVRTASLGRTYSKRPCARKACGKQFMPTGPRALYCSSRCRKLDASGERNAGPPPDSGATWAQVVAGVTNASSTVVP